MILTTLNTVNSCITLLVIIAFASACQFKHGHATLSFLEPLINIALVLLLITFHITMVMEELLTASRTLEISLVIVGPTENENRLFYLECVFDWKL